MDQVIKGWEEKVRELVFPFGEETHRFHGADPEKTISEFKNAIPLMRDTFDEMYAKNGEVYEAILKKAGGAVFKPWHVETEDSLDYNILWS